MSEQNKLPCGCGAMEAAAKMREWADDFEAAAQDLSRSDIQNRKIKSTLLMTRAEEVRAAAQANPCGCVRASAWIADPEVKECLRSFHETTRVLKSAALSQPHFEGPDVARVIASVPDLQLAGRGLIAKLAEFYRIAGLDPNSCEAIRNWTAADAKSRASA